VWHFMRRLAGDCTSKSHPLYGPFMSRLSAAIFEWDRSDLDLLLAAKRSELIAAGVPNSLQRAVQKAVSEEERLARKLGGFPTDDGLSKNHKNLWYIH
jgi:hypothetical protein